ncbi:MAG: response regulator [Bacteroidales bacterium]|nr:response regulator [Bacteroidales bacterium]MCF8389561.1 response regulator [Bacteroidales bacterium]
MKRSIHIFQIISFIFLCQLSFAQSNESYFFEKISIREGLSHIGVNTIFQDSKGFIWVGTYDGLNRYDGINFKIFHNIPYDSSSLIHNRVNSMVESYDSLLWIGTEEGLCYFNQSTEKFGTLKLEGFMNARINVTKLYEDSKHRLWILSNNNAIYIIQKDRSSYHRVVYQSNSSNPANFYDIASGPDGSFYLCSNKGLIVINDDLEIEPVISDNPFLKQEMKSIVIQDDSLAWIGSKDGLFLTEILKQKNTTDFKPIKSILKGQKVNSILIDNESNIWVSMMEKGLNKIIPKNGDYEVKTFNPNPYDINSLPSNRIRCLYEDRQGILWIGTPENGMIKFKLSSYAFFNLNKVSDYNFDSGSDIVLSFAQLENKYILIGARDKGVSLINCETNEIIKVPFNFNLVANKSVSSILVDSRNIIWLRTWDGLYYLPPGSNELIEVDNVETDQEGICEDDDGNILIATSKGIRKFLIGSSNDIAGVEVIDLQLDSENSNIRSKLLYSDPFDETIWMGTFHHGMIHLDLNETSSLNTLKFKQYKSKPDDQSLQSNFISSIIRTSERDLWIGTEGSGLAHGLFTDDSLIFTTYNETHGLSNNSVKAILEDESGNLWVSTNFGLNKFIIETSKFIAFDFYDGLASDFFTSAALKLSDNRIILGGNNGLTLFDPDVIRDDTITPLPEFGSFKLFSKTILPNDKVNNKILLTKSISELEHLELAYNQNTFSFELLALNFSSPKNNSIKYRLYGYDKDWIYYNKGHYTANYSRIKPGNYNLEFYTANRHGVWSDKSKSIDITILPPFWANTYAFVFYIIVFITVSLLILKNSRRILHLKQKVKIEEIELLKTKELNESKLKFFMNVSHEFKTPISLIAGPAQWLLKHHGYNSSISKHLTLIKGQSDYLVSLLDQLVYFRKAESDTLKLKCKYNDIVSFIELTKSLYEWQANEQRIDFSFLHPNKDVFLWFDSKCMDIILHNLISNAFKFTNPGGKIILSLYMDADSDWVYISIKDTGKGISPENIQHIFQRFYKENSDVAGYGIGLSLTKSLIELHGGNIEVSSTPGKGTKFVISFKKGSAHLSKEQIIEMDSLKNKSGLSLDDDKGKTESGESIINVSQKSEKESILLVEDNLKMLEFLKDVLKDFYNIETACNGSEAMDIMKNWFPDLIISDLMMPEMDGITLCKNIKSNQLTCHIPVVLLSAKGDIESRIEGLEHGADHYIPKPVDINLLLAEIQSIISNRNKIKERIRLKLPFDFEAKDVHPLDKIFIEKVRAIVEESYTDPYFDSKAFSKKIFINRSLFYKKMKAVTNQTPFEFLREYRMNKAIELIMEDKATISEVNTMVGILSRPHFIKCFKATYGTLPSKFFQKNGIDTKL